mgnify:CR=1 FL=1
MFEVLCLFDSTPSHMTNVSVGCTYMYVIIPGQTHILVIHGDSRVNGSLVPCVLIFSKSNGKRGRNSRLSERWRSIIHFILISRCCSICS